MDYTINDLSPVRKKIAIVLQPEEVTASIMAAVALYRNSVQIDGFRKGKVPANIVEKRFHDQLYNDAKQDLINVHLNEIIQKESLSPLAGVSVDDANKQLERGKGFEYSIEFDILPIFDLPQYEGLEVEQVKNTLNQKNVEAIFDGLRRRKAQFIPVEGNVPATDGQVANIDFEAFENGQSVAKASDFNLVLGEERALKEFEDLVKTISAGEEKEAQIHFPPDFLEKRLADKTVNMKVRVNAVKNIQLPELDDAFAQSMDYENMDEFRSSIEKGMRQSQENLEKGGAQRKLIDQMLQHVDFPVPDSLLKIEKQALLNERIGHLASQGKSLEALGKNMEELEKELQPQAEHLAKAQTLLLSIAKKENLQVSDREVNEQILKDCLRSGEDFNQTRQYYERTGTIFILRDRLLADKAIDLVYARAKVTMVEPKQTA